MRIVLPWKQNHLFQTWSLLFLFVYAVLQKHYEAIILCFLLKLCLYECGWGKF